MRKSRRTNESTGGGPDPSTLWGCIEYFEEVIAVLQVVHNYGHGAEGVTLSWGTACHAARLVNDFIINRTRSKL